MILLSVNSGSELKVSAKVTRIDITRDTVPIIVIMLNMLKNERCILFFKIITPLDSIIFFI